MKKQVLFMMGAVVLMHASLFAQCTAGFTWSQSQPNVIDFVNTSVQNPGNQYSWYFGDTLSDYGPGPIQHTYYVPGTYYACLWVYDSASQTSCNYCDTVTVTGVTLCNMLVSTYGSVESYPGSADAAAGISNITGGTPPYSFTWSTGATSYSVSGLTAGTYWVCVSDSGNVCTTCDTVQITSNDSNSCQIVNLAATTTAEWVNGDVSAWGVSYNDVVYTWDFGDTTTLNGGHVWHHYLQPGTYNICVFLYDTMNGCRDTSCQNVTIVPNAQGCNAAFTVQPDTTNPNQAWITNFSTGSPMMEYHWFWGDQSPADTGAYPVHVYQSSGTYWITLAVVDTANNCIDSTNAPLMVPRFMSQAAQTPYYVNVIPPLSASVPDAVTTQGINIYPNPVHSTLNLNGTVPADCRYLITDVSGRTVVSGTISGKTVDVGMLESGLYFFTLIRETGAAETQQFIRE